MLPAHDLGCGGELVHVAMWEVEEACTTISSAKVGVYVCVAGLGRQPCFVGLRTHVGVRFRCLGTFKNRKNAALAHLSLLSIMESRKAAKNEHNNSFFLAYVSRIFNSIKDTQARIMLLFSLLSNVSSRYTSVGAGTALPMHPCASRRMPQS